MYECEGGLVSLDIEISAMQRHPRPIANVLAKLMQAFTVSGIVLATIHCQPLA